jgi:iron complex outermembrane receptor protein
MAHRFSASAGARLHAGTVLYLATTSVSAALGLPMPAEAQAAAEAAPGDGSVIVVSAQRRQELARDVPITVTSANADQLQTANVQSLVSLPKLAPGIRIDQQGSYTQPTIRGIGTTLVQTGVGNR